MNKITLDDFMFQSQGFVTDIQFYRDNSFEAGIKTNIKLNYI